MSGTSKIALGVVTGILIGHFLTRIVFSNGNSAQSDAVCYTTPQTLEHSQKIEVPFVDFEDTSLEEAIDYLRSISRSGRDVPGEPPQFRLNFIVHDPEHGSRSINLSMMSVRLDQLCERIAQAAGVNVTFESDAIVFSTREFRGEKPAR
jgi:hypothetical protein